MHLRGDIKGGVSSRNLCQFLLLIIGVIGFKIITTKNKDFETTKTKKSEYLTIKEEDVEEELGEELRHSNG